MIRISKISSEDCTKNKNAIAELLFLNDKAHDYTESCTIDESIEEVENMITYIDANKADVFCAFDDDLIIGLIWAFPLRFRDELRMHIKAMVVNPEYRRQGLAQKLLMEVDKASLARRITVVDTYVDWSNIKARCAYEKHGLVPDRILVRKKLNNEMDANQ